MLGAALTSVPDLARVAADHLAQSSPLPADQLTRLQEACGATRAERSWFCSRAFELTHNVGFSKAIDDLSPLVSAVVILFVAWLVSRLVRVAIRRAVRRLETDASQTRLQTIRRRTGLSLLETSGQSSPMRRGQRAHTIGAGLRSVASIIIWTIAGIMVLGVFAVDLGPLLAGAGLIGIVLGFGAQTVVSDFLAGMFMIFEDQFGVGDIIDVGFATGTVENISLRVTRLRDIDGVVWHVPNGQVQRIGNLSQEWSRARLDVAVAYDTDLALAKRVILETADEMAAAPDWSSRILDPPELWGVEDFASDAITIRLVIKTKPQEQWAVAREYRARLKEAFDRHGIEIPFPQRTVWLRNVVPAPLPDEGETTPPAETGAREPASPSSGASRRDTDAAADGDPTGD